MNITIRKPVFKLSKSSMGLDKNKKYTPQKSYQRRGVRIFKKKYQRLGKNFRILVVRPPYEWFPSKYANFTFGFNDQKPEW